MKITNQTRKTDIASQAELADTAISRIIGLLGRAYLADQQALIITQCRSIHMLFMRFPIDVIFVDRNRVVVGLVQGIKPYRFSPYFWRAHFAVEAPPGAIVRSKTALGDVIQWS